MKEIKLTQNKIALIDDEDFEKVNQFKWHAAKYYNNKYYAKTGCYLKMHRVIMNIIDSKIHIDHINGNGLDNRKSNLRIATSQQNSANRGKQKNNENNFKGVSFRKDTKKYRARIQFNNKLIVLGEFKTEIKAAKAYDIAATKYFGEFANLNFKKI